MKSSFLLILFFLVDYFCYIQLCFSVLVIPHILVLWFRYLFCECQWWLGINVTVLFVCSFHMKISEPRSFTCCLWELMVSIFECCMKPTNIRIAVKFLIVGVSIIVTWLVRTFVACTHANLHMFNSDYSLVITTK